MDATDHRQVDLKVMLSGSGNTRGILEGFLNLEAHLN